MKHAILALALFAAPAAAQTITTTAKVSIGGCGTVAIPKGAADDRKALTVQAECFEQAEGIANGAKVARLERIKALAPDLPPIGISAVPASYYGTERIWANLAYRASEWSNVVGGINRYGNPNTAGRIGLQAPNDVYLGKATKITCTWQGNGTGFVNGSVPNWVRSDKGSLTFTWNPAGPPGKHGGVWFDLSGSDGTFRDLDCREPGVVSNGRLDQRYVDDMRVYRVVRFLDWSTANKNEPISWATRQITNQQRSGTFTGDQPLEDQIEIANAIGGDAWFTIPWNADDDYVRRMATLIRDTLKGKAYFETGNEVWNWMFKVTGQAQAEGEAANLAGSGNKWDNTFLRYAEKTVEQNKIVTDVFKAQPKRLVRVASFQNGNTNALSIFLRYPDAINWVDAFADAPYFGVNDLNTTTRYTGTQDELFAKVEVERKKSIALTSNIAAAAKKLGKLSMIYEGGNGTISSDVNADINEALQRSPLMEAAYDRYLADLRAVHTGPIMLYNSTGATSKYGSWGQHEFTGQPAKDAPKWRAIAKAVVQR